MPVASALLSDGTMFPSITSAAALSLVPAATPIVGLSFVPLMFIVSVSDFCGRFPSCIQILKESVTFASCPSSCTFVSLLLSVYV